MFMNLFMYFYTIFCFIFVTTLVKVIWIDKNKLNQLERDIKASKHHLDDNYEVQMHYITMLQEKNSIMFPTKVIRVVLLVVAIIAIRKIVLIEPLYLFGFRVGFIITILVVIIISMIYTYIIKKLGVRI